MQIYSGKSATSANRICGGAVSSAKHNSRSNIIEHSEPENVVPLIPAVQVETAPPSSEQIVVTAQQSPVSGEKNGSQGITSDSEVSPAEARLQEAAAKLKSKLMMDLLHEVNMDFGPIQGHSDINSVAQQIGTAVVALMDQRHIAKSKQGPAKTFVQTWVKKALPFIQDGLSAAKVFVSNTLLALGFANRLRILFQLHME